MHSIATSIPIEQLRNDPDLSPEARSRLETLPELLEFARHRGLRVGGAYRRVDFNERPASWIVAAADPVTVTLHRWKFPIVGEVPYKGFRFREHAVREAKLLADQGLIAEVLPVSAWSSLGWFPEPLPSSLLELAEHRFATTVLHELVHRTIHISGESDLNEGLATFLGSRLAEEWLISQHGEVGDILTRHRSRERDEIWSGRSPAFAYNWQINRGSSFRGRNWRIPPGRCRGSCSPRCMTRGACLGVNYG